jgi:pilus assembly protein Flp/PilA
MEVFMSKLQALTVRFVKEDRGAAMIEYSILIGLIAAALITSVAAVAVWMTGRWAALCGALGIACA